LGLNASAEVWIPRGTCCTFAQAIFVLGSATALNVVKTVGAFYKLCNFAKTLARAWIEVSLEFVGNASDFLLTDAIASVRIPNEAWCAFTEGAALTVASLDRN
jgi:hypothetical protein